MSTVPILKAAILVISTTAARDNSQDSSGSILDEVFRQGGGRRWEVIEKKIVGDIVDDIQETIKDWTDREDTINVIVTTGGTGFAVHDITPEVIDLCA